MTRADPPVPGAAPDDIDLGCAAGALDRDGAQAQVPAPTPLLLDLVGPGPVVSGPVVSGPVGPGHDHHVARHPSAGRSPSGWWQSVAVSPGARRLGGRRVLAWWRELPGAAQVLIIYAVSRWFDFLVISRVARFQPPSLWNRPDPGYLGVVSLWDGDWYRRVAESGYPHSLPIDGYGHVAQNEWAFYPLYPFTVRGVIRLFGTGWPVSASLVSLVCGGIAVLIMRSLVEAMAGRSVAMWTVALFCFFPSAPVLQLAYTESMSIMLLAWALWCLQRRRYVQAIPVVLLIGFVRPIGVPVAAVVGLHLLRRMLRRRTEPLTGRSLTALLALATASAIAALEWTVAVGRLSGAPNGYADTMAAWRVNHEIVPVKPWWRMSQYFLGGWTGPVVLAVIVMFAVWLLAHPTARVIAGDLRTWVACYLGYLVVVLDPSTSLVRYLLPMFPIGTVLVSASASPAYRRTLLLAFAAGQVLWVSWLWRFSPPTDWPP
jgi:hypothetical protein